MQYDFLVVGSGLFGSVFAHEVQKAGKKVLVLERRNQIGGNVYCENLEGINIHKFGPHIFHTSDEKVWKYVNKFVKFNNFINTPIAKYHDEFYNLPFNMYTFVQMWGVQSVQEAKQIINEQSKSIKEEPRNLEEQAISMVGKDIYLKLIKDYTEKQWGRKCAELPAFIIRRIPLRYEFNNNYYDDKYQGIPIGGYNNLIISLLKGVDIILGVDYNLQKMQYKNIAKMVVYTGSIDSFYDYRFGKLDYRGLRFETEKREISKYQKVAIINYTDRETPFTRIIEHKHFENGKQPYTYITREFPLEWKLGDEAYYPINDSKNENLYKKYFELAKNETDVIFGGRLAEYKYYDMDQIIKKALDISTKILKRS